MHTAIQRLTSLSQFNRGSHRAGTDPVIPPCTLPCREVAAAPNVFASRPGRTRSTTGRARSAKQAAATNPTSQHSDNGTALHQNDYAKFVRFFRQASPYIAGHRERTFVIIIPGEVMSKKALLNGLVEDIALLHSLGTRLVVVLGAAQQINEYLRLRGLEPTFVGGYRVTDETTMLAAMEAAGTARVEVEAQLSKALAVPMVRRHTRGQEEYHYGPAVRVVSGNYVTGKRRGIVDGIHFGATGSVRFVQKEAVEEQLNMGHIVLLSNLAYSAAGEVLNCNTYEVATHAAIELGADKLCCMCQEEISGLPQWLPLPDAEALIQTALSGSDGIPCLEESSCSVQYEEEDSQTGVSNGLRNGSSRDHASVGAYMQMAVKQIRNGNSNGTGMHKNGRAVSRGIEVNLDSWHAYNFPNSVLAAVVACKNGVKRAHLVDARQDGALLLELYSRDGVGTMISTDFYEGIRPAIAQDLPAIADLLEPLQQEGILKRRSRENLIAELNNFTVVERESKVLACVLVSDLGATPDGVQCGELAAFCVHPSYRGSGRGDSLLDYVEQRCRAKGIRRLVLLTTRTADWFEQRDFTFAGSAHQSELLPDKRRREVDPARNSQLYVKRIYDLDDKSTPVGKRIGF